MAGTGMGLTIDHQPRHGWEVRDGRNVIVLHVPEYKEHEMRVTLRNGVLTVTGDRNSEGSETDRVKFNKTFSIFKNYRHEDIQAKLANGGYLRIILPSNFKTNQTDDQNGYNSWLARTLSELSFDKRLAANAAAFVLVLSGFAVGGYFAFRHV